MFGYTEIKGQNQFEFYLNKLCDRDSKMKLHKILFVDFEVRVEVKIYDEHYDSKTKRRRDG